MSSGGSSSSRPRSSSSSAASSLSAPARSRRRDTADVAAPDLPPSHPPSPPPHRAHPEGADGGVWRSCPQILVGLAAKLAVTIGTHAALPYRAPAHNVFASAVSSAMITLLLGMVLLKLQAPPSRATRRRPRGHAASGACEGGRPGGGRTGPPAAPTTARPPYAPLAWPRRIGQEISLRLEGHLLSPEMRYLLAFDADSLGAIMLAAAVLGLLLLGVVMLHALWSAPSGTRRPPVRPPQPTPQQTPPPPPRHEPRPLRDQPTDEPRERGGTEEAAGTAAPAVAVHATAGRNATQSARPSAAEGKSSPSFRSVAAATHMARSSAAGKGECARARRRHSSCFGFDDGTAASISLPGRESRRLDGGSSHGERSSTLCKPAKIPEPARTHRAEGCEASAETCTPDTAPRSARPVPPPTEAKPEREEDPVRVKRDGVVRV